MEIFESTLQRRLGPKIGAPVDLTITDNRSSMIHIRKNGKGYIIRLHHMFIDADNSVLNDIAQFARTGKSSLLQHYIDSHMSLIKKPVKREPQISTRGAYYNLTRIYNSLNRIYFSERVKCRITWGRSRRGKNKRAIQFGCYDRSMDLIRINPKLDSARVPRYFIEYIVFHEMLHSVHSPASKGSHTQAFKERERAFKHYQQACAWQKKNIGLFIR